MAKVKSITARNGGEIVDGAIEKLAAYAKSLGLGVEQSGKWKYFRDGSALEVTLKFTVGGEEGIEAAQRKHFETFARYYGLENSDFGNQFTNRGTTYKVVGFNTHRRSKYPYRCIDIATGKEVGFSELTKHAIIAGRKMAA